MKICLVTHTMPRYKGDSAAPFIAELANSLTDLGHQVTIVAPFDSKIDFNEARKYHLATYRYIFPDSWHLLGYSRTLQSDKQLSLAAYILSPMLFIFGFFKLLSVVKSQHTDIISAHWIIPNGFLAALVSRLTSVPFVVTIPGSDIYLGSRNTFFRSMVSLAAKLAKFVISDSQHYIDQLHVLGIRPLHESVIRYGVDTQKFKITPKSPVVLSKLGLSAKLPVILAVGRLVPKKGFKYLIAAMPEVLRQIPNAKLVIIGDGDQKKALLNQIADLNISDSVLLPGTVPHTELNQYYNVCDVFAMPSVQDESGNIDASPVAMMEAMSCGKPVVATKFSGSSEIINHGVTGFLVSEKNSKQIAVAIITLLLSSNNKSAQNSIRNVALKNFSTEIIAKRYSKIFQQSLNRPC